MDRTAATRYALRSTADSKTMIFIEMFLFFKKIKNPVLTLLNRNLRQWPKDNQIERSIKLRQELYWIDRFLIILRTHIN